MFYNDKYKHLEPEIRSKMLFDTDTRMRIRQKLDMSEASLNNNISELKKLGVIKDNMLVKTFAVFVNGAPEEIIFKFNVQEDPGNDST